VLLVIGVSESATVNNIIVAIKVTVILAVHRVGAFFVNPDNWHPFIPEPRASRTSSAGTASSAATIVFFRLHRLRGGLDRGPGGAQSAQGHAHRHPGSLIVCTFSTC
jgi:APA family basic amino acid/polyamine antiporter